MFNFFRTRDKLGKQTQSAETHNPIRRAALEGQMNALGNTQGVPLVSHGNVSLDPNPEATFWRASSLRKAEEVKRLSGLLAIHNDRYAKQMAGLKKATKASADRRRASKP